MSNNIIEKQARREAAARARAEERYDVAKAPEIKDVPTFIVSLRERDVAQVIRLVPRAIKQYLGMTNAGGDDWGVGKRDANGIFFAGGMVRSAVAGEPVADVDISVATKEIGARLARYLEKVWNTKAYITRNAFTLRNPDGPDVQIITRWLYDTAPALVQSYDFTVCQAAVWWHGDCWVGVCSENFYPDLAAKRLVYTSPRRDEAPGGSIMRAFKYTRKGYYLDLPSLALLVDRLMAGVDRGRMERSGIAQARVILGLLEEVDPAMTHLTGVADPTLV